MDGSQEDFAFEMGVEVVDGSGLVAGPLAPDPGSGAGVGMVGHKGVEQVMERAFGESASGRVGDLVTTHDGVGDERMERAAHCAFPAILQTRQRRHDVVLRGVQEDEAQDDVLVVRRVHVVAELVGSEPERARKAEVSGGVLKILVGCTGHIS